jgi:uncharacterized protein YecT (DUF1311 family)
VNNGNPPSMSPSFLDDGLTGLAGTTKIILCEGVHQGRRRFVAHRLSVSLVMLVACAKAAAVQHSAQPECPDSATNQGAMTVCSGEAFKGADRRLTELIAELRDSLSPPQRAQLDSTQRAWSTYAAVQCRLESAVYEGGTMSSMQVSRCRRGLAERRIKELAPLLCNLGAPPEQPCQAAERYTGSPEVPVPRP